MYEIWSKDRTQAVFMDKDTGSFHIMDSRQEAKRYELLKTESRDFIKSVWEMTGGEYGDMEIMVCLKRL